MAGTAGRPLVRVLYDYDYKTNDGVLVNLKKGTEYSLLKKSNEEWWAVTSPSEKLLFVPANYVEIIKKSDHDKKVKKKPPPPKPPKPKLPQPALDEDSVLKQLDDMLDREVLIDDDGGDKDSNDNLSLKDEGRARTPEKEKEDSPEKVTLSSENVSKINHSVENNLRPSDIQGNNQMFGKTPSQGTTTASLDRKLTKPPESGHSRSASASAVPTGGSHGSERPKVSPRLTNINYNEPPMYANLQDLEESRKEKVAALDKPIPPKRSDADDDEPNYANLSTIQSSMYPMHPPPKKPPPGVTPIRILDSDWCMYGDEESSHPYYYNSTTGESRWRPPGNGPSEVTEEEDVPKNSAPAKSAFPGSSHIKLLAPSVVSSRMNSFGTATTLEGFRDPDNILTRIDKGSLPSGWSEKRTDEGEVFYENEYNNERWFQRSAGESGQLYYYKEGTSESSWELPEINSAGHQISLDKALSDADRLRLNLPKTRASWSPGDYSQVKRVGIPLPRKLSPTVKEEEEEGSVGPGEVFEAAAEAEVPPHQTVRASTIAQYTRLPPPPAAPAAHSAVRGPSVSALPPHLDLQAAPVQLRHSQVERAAAPTLPVIREMQILLNRTKVTENGKKVKKNWSTSYVVTTGPFMYFYKDQKSTQPKPNMPVGKYEVQLDLRGAKIDPAPKDLSSKKNVFLLATTLGSQYLLQSDNKAMMNDFHSTLLANLKLLGQSTDMREPENTTHFDKPPDSPNLTKGSKFKRSGKKGSTLERPTTPDDMLQGVEKNNKIKDWLLYWLLRRPTAETLKEKGIIKDGIFGSHLQSICDREKVTVPRFVHHCIEAVEHRGLMVDGIYRISGNMAVIQKLRFQVDQNEVFDLLDVTYDIHDISGALKLFFRELQEPLYPFSLYDKFTKASQILNRQLKLKAFQDTIKELPKVNYHTMRDLFGHLRRVVEHSKENRMEAQNVAIVFGPTLMRPRDEIGNMAANLVMQGQIVEYMLLEFRSLF